MKILENWKIYVKIWQIQVDIMEDYLFGFSNWESQSQIDWVQADEHELENNNQQEKGEEKNSNWIIR